MAYQDGWPTLSELAKQLDPDGTLADVGELLSETNDMLDDIPFFEANGKTTHQITVDSSLPEGTWRKLNYGIQPKKGATAQVKEQIGLLENRSEVDVVMARMSSDIAKFRLNGARRILEGLSQQLAETFLYGDSDDYPERFMGFAPRYASLGNPSDVPTANTLGMNRVLSAGGSTADVQTSAWIVGWGEGRVYGVYPEGSMAGLEDQDLGEIDSYDADGNVLRVLANHYRIQQGLAVEDWRYVVRVANIEVSAAITDTIINSLVDNLIDATNAIPNLSACRPVIYTNRATRSYLQKAAVRKTNMALGINDVYGVQNQLNISGIPIKQSDAILLTEAVVS